MQRREDLKTPVNILLCLTNHSLLGGHTKAASYPSFIVNSITHSVPEAAKIARLEYANIKATHAFAREHSIACESQPRDSFDILYNPLLFRLGSVAIGILQKTLGPNDPAGRYEILDAQQARNQTLCPGENVAGAFRYEAGSISAYKFATGVLRVCMEKGMNLQTFTPVQNISSAGDGTWTAATDRGNITTSKLILATNGYTAHLVPEFLGRIVPHRGQVTAQRPGGKLTGLKPDGLPTTYSFVIGNGFDYMVPRPPLPEVPKGNVGDIIIGGGAGTILSPNPSQFGQTDDTVLNPAVSKALHAALPLYFGANWGVDNAELRVRKEWSGVIGGTIDGAPFVGAVPEKKGLWVSAGFNGNGKTWSLSLGKGRLLT
jgi:glycine/D-amino acid oxidase-like deaminating enzyme